MALKLLQRNNLCNLSCILLPSLLTFMLDKLFAETIFCVAYFFCFCSNKNSYLRLMSRHIRLGILFVCIFFQVMQLSQIFFMQLSQLIFMQLSQILIMQLCQIFIHGA